MKLPTIFNIENLFMFYQTMKEKYGEVISHIKFPEYSVSIPSKEAEFSELIKELGWNNIYYISLFVKPIILIKFDLLEEEVTIKCESSELEDTIEELIKHSF